MLTIVTVLWRGDFRGRNYTHEHVRSLEHQCRRWVSAPFKFVCLTNDPDPTADYIQPLLQCPDSLVGWWAKLELFGEQLKEAKRVLYFDLDTIICDSLDPIVKLEFPQDRILFAPPLGTPSTNPTITKGVVTRFQSSVIMFDQPKVLPGTVLHDSVFHDLLKRKYRGDQDYFGVHFEEVGEVLPISWFMKLKDCWDSGPVPPVKVIFGHPKPLWNQRMEKSWVRELLQ